MDAAVHTVETRRHPGLLQSLKVTSHLLDLGIATGSESARLASALITLFLETDYCRITPDQSESIVTLTLARAAAGEAGARPKVAGIL